MKGWKFISRSTNYRVTLKHGIPAEPLTGRNATPGVYAKFEDGILTVTDEKMADMLMKHAGFGSDYVLSEDSNEKDPFFRNNVGEPEHDITEIKYGSIGKSVNPKPKVKLTKETQKAIEKMAEKIANEKFAELVNNFVGEKKAELEKIADDKAVDADEAPADGAPVDEPTEEVTEEPKATTTKKKPGRKKKVK